MQSQTHLTPKLSASLLNYQAWEPVQGWLRRWGAGVELHFHSHPLLISPERSLAFFFPHDPKSLSRVLSLVW